MLFRQDLHTFAGVYALDAWDTAAEQDRFERHMHRCQSCTGEVRGFRETATRLGMAASRQPPPTLRPRVMAAVARTRQLPATEDHARHARPAPRLRPVPRLVAAAGALGVVAALVLGVLFINAENQLSQTRHQLTQTQHQLSEARSQVQAIDAVRSAPDVTLLSARTSIGGAAAVEVSPSRHQMVVSTAGLPALKAGKVYQLWLIGGKGTHNPIRSEGLLPAPHHGRTGPFLVSGLLAGDIFGITIEPAGGTAQPTVPPIVGIKVPA